MAFNEGFVSGAEVRRKKPVGIIAGICAVVIVGGAALAYNFVPFIKNSVRMAVMKPENYFETVETENLRNTAGDIAERYKKTYEFYNADTIGGKIGFSADLAEPYDFNGVNIENISGNIDFTYNPEIIGEDIALSVNNTDVFDVDAVISIAENTMFMKIAGLSDDFINMDLDDTYGLNLSDTISGTNIYKIYEPEKLEESINRYGDVLISYLAENGKISIEKACEGTAADVSYRYNKIEIEINEKILDEACLKVLEELKNDSEIKEIYNSYADIYSETSYDEIEDYDTAIDEMISDMQSDLESADENETGIVAVYVDANGTVRGHQIYDDEFSIGYSVAKDGNSYGIEFSVNDDGSEDYIKINAAENNGAYTGVCNIADSDEDTIISIGFENLKIEDEEKGLASGSLSMDLSSIDDSLSDFEIVMTVENGVQKFSFTIPDMADVSISAALDANAEKAAVPDKSISMDDISDEQGQQFVMDLFEKLGIDADDLYSEYDDTDYDDYDYSYDDVADYDDVDYNDDFSDDYDTDDTYVAEYNMADAEIKINGSPVLMPAAMPEVYNILAADENSQTYGVGEDLQFMMNGDGSLYAVFSGQSADINENTPVSGIVYSHTLGQQPLVDISVNGIGAGSTIQSAIDAFGLSADETQIVMDSLSNSAYYIELDDISNDCNIILGFENSMVTYIAIDYTNLV